MKILDRYIISSIMKTAVVATLVFSLLLAGVELFQKMDSIITGEIPVLGVIEYALLCIPEYFILVFSISLLFGSTYFQSSLSANNERIALLNAGVSKWRLFRPVFILAIILTLFGFILSESLLRELETKKTTLSEELFGSSSTRDSRNIVLKDGNGYVVYTRRFIESEERILDPIIVKEKDGRLIMRVSGSEGLYRDGCWTIYDAFIYSLSDDGATFNLERNKSITLEDLTIESEYFRATNINVETMDAKTAFAYLSKLSTAQKEVWQEKCTDYLRRFFQPLSIVLLLSISALFDYNLKKNVLLFSVIESLCVAVVYYVSDMVFSIAAHQGAYSPAWAVILPLLSTIVIAAGINELGKRV